MESDWSVSTLDGHSVALVTVDIRNPSPVDRRVRVSNRLNGPVMPPRRAGVPVFGWSENRFEGVVPAEGRRTLGYACPAPSRRPPVSVVDAGRIRDDAADTVDAAADAVRELGDPRPPGDAIPVSGPTGDASDAPTAEDRTATVPPAVESWLTAVEDRIERGERLTDASVASATDTLDSENRGDVDDLSRRVAADAAALEAVVARAATLEERAAAVAVPVDALRGLL
ncbi:MAG: hypothetical protein ABEH58_01875 [Haloplanus sp.]